MNVDKQVRQEYKAYFQMRLHHRTPKKSCYLRAKNKWQSKLS